MHWLLMIRSSTLAQVQWALTYSQIFKSLQRVLIGISLLQLLLMNYHRMRYVANTLQSFIRGRTYWRHIQFITRYKHILRILDRESSYLLEWLALNDIVEKRWSLSAGALILGILKALGTARDGKTWVFEMFSVLIRLAGSWEVTLRALTEA
jgi:hypothetical protein